MSATRSTAELRATRAIYRDDTQRCPFGLRLSCESVTTCALECQNPRNGPTFCRGRRGASPLRGSAKARGGVASARARFSFLKGGRRAGPGRCCTNASHSRDVVSAPQRTAPLAGRVSAYAQPQAATGGSVTPAADRVVCTPQPDFFMQQPRLVPVVPTDQITTAETAAPERTRQCGPARSELGLHREDPPRGPDSAASDLSPRGRCRRLRALTYARPHRRAGGRSCAIEVCNSCATGCCTPRPCGRRRWSRCAPTSIPTRSALRISSMAR
jgi:hypothetical protein